MRIRARYVEEGRKIRIEDSDHDGAWLECDMTGEDLLYIRSGGSVYR